jgi:hypothetical protein
MMQQQQQPQVEGFLGGLGGLGELTGSIGDLAGLGFGIYQTVHPNVEDEIEVQAYRRPTSTSRTSSSTMHPIEMAHLGTQMLTGLAGTGAGMYSQIMQGQAAAAEQQYYQQQMAQQQP